MEIVLNNKMKTVSCNSCNKEFVVPLYVPEPFTCCTMPPLHKQAVNVVTSLTEHAFNGFKKDEKTKEERLKICEGCDLYKNKRCTQCGCFMEVKTSSVTSKCPIGKW